MTPSARGPRSPRALAQEQARKLEAANTELARQREALRQSEERLRLAQQAARLGSFEWNIQTGVERMDAGTGGDVRPAAGRLRRHRVLGAVGPPRRPDAAVGAVERALATGEPTEAEWRVIWPDGTERWLAGRFQAFKDESGHPLRLTGVNIDITERKAAEQAVRESEERLAFALETSRTGAWDLDLVDHTAFRSLEHDRIFGYAELLPEWTYEMFLAHVLPEDRAEVDEKFRQATATLGDWQFRVPHPTRRRPSPLDLGRRTSSRRRVRPDTPNGGHCSGSPSASGPRPSASGCWRRSGTARSGCGWRSRRRALAPSSDIQTGVEEWTPELEAMYGLPPGGFAGTQRAWEQSVHPADRSAP